MRSSDRSPEITAKPNGERETVELADTSTATLDADIDPRRDVIAPASHPADPRFTTPVRGDEVTIDAASLGPTPASGGRPRDAATLSARADGALDMGLVESGVEPVTTHLSSLPVALQDRFESLYFLGEGAMGAVYRTRDRRLGRDVALKILFGGGAETSSRLLREARSQARLEHENACKVYEAGVADGHRYIVMQFIDGEPLDKAKQRMTLEEKVRAIRQVAVALHEAHRLGLVHRDIKPSNIMVEQGEDGAYKPYLMDFGLAREMGGIGDTMTGAIAGTPAFMAPEQALGEIRSLDRRTDVYSLGATMYDLLSGRPPFLDESIFKLLKRVTVEDPIALRKVRPEIPEDLEAIVMKCLEKEPGRRYESARAFGEDLQRFLDGEPVAARRASLGYVVLKKIRRHKGKVALASAAVIVVLAIVGAWARDRQIAAERAQLSRELGEDVKEMELFLRNGYSLPLHDIEREKAVVRDRLAGIEARMAAAGPAGQGPGHYALGRGYLALREHEKALGHLRRAREAGYAPPELDYAAGLTLGEIYKRELEATKRIENPEKKKARVAAIEAEYRDAALGHLRAALGARLDTSAYVEGLIALYEGKNAVALEKAAEAFRRAPWLFEAKKLEGDAHFAEGSRFRFDAAYDYARMMEHFERADAAYRETSDIARSDPDAHLATCELWTQVMGPSEEKPELLKSSFEKANAACERGVAASPGSPAARIKMAFAHQVFAWNARAVAPAGETPDAIIERAVARAQEAARVGPDDAMASYVLGAAHRVKYFFLMNQGLDAGGSIDRAIAAYNDATRLDPAFLWAHVELCSSFAQRALSESWRGLDPVESVERAAAHCDRAIALEPTFALAYINKALAHLYMALHQAEVGAPPDKAVASALAASEAAKERNPGSMGAQNLAAWAHYAQILYDEGARRDVERSLGLMEQSLREVQKMAPSSYVASELLGRFAAVKAEHLLRQGKSADAELKEARSALDRLVADSPWDYDFRLVRANVEVIAARSATSRGEAATEEVLAAAEKLLLPMLERERARPHLYQALAEIQELRARSLLASKKKADGAISKGIEMADKALAINAKMASTHAVKKSLNALRERAALPPGSKK